MKILKTFMLTVTGIVLCFASVRADAPSDETTKQVVTGNALVLASGEHDDYPISKDKPITAIVRGDEIVSNGIGGTPIGTTVYPVKVTFKCPFWASKLLCSISSEIRSINGRLLKYRTRFLSSNAIGYTNFFSLRAGAVTSSNL
jgi:hypothetical protein